MRRRIATRRLRITLLWCVAADGHGPPPGEASPRPGGAERPARAADHRYRTPVMTGAELTTASEAKPSRLPRLDTTTGATPRTSNIHPATAVRFTPSTATTAARTKLMTARMGPCRSSNARHPSGFTASQTLTAITAAIRAANMRVAQSGRYQAAAARAASGTAQATTSPSAFQPPGSANVSPTTKSPKTTVTNAATPKPARLRMRACVSGSRCLTRNTIAKITMTTRTGKPTVMSYLHPGLAPDVPRRSGWLLAL